MERASGYLRKAWSVKKKCHRMILKRVHSFHHSFSYSLNHHPLKFHKRKLDRKKVIKHSYSQNPICIYLTTLHLSIRPFRYLFWPFFCSYSFVNFLCLTLSILLIAAVFVFKARRAWTFGLCLFLINIMISLSLVA